MISACTVITLSRVAHARVLARSFLEHHPNGRFSALVIDDLHGSLREEPFEIVRPADLDLDHSEFLRMAAAYDALELCCAMKAFAISHELASTDAVLYLDSDVDVYDRLDGALELARLHGLVLTPHVVEPPPRPPSSFAEESMLWSGTFNAGFLAVSRQATLFLDWWRARLTRQCLNEPDMGYFVDQRWLNLAVGYFSHYVLRDPGWNVAPWNLISRKVERPNGAYTAGGAPLRFFHFGGFEPEAPYLVSRWMRPKPNIRLSQESVLAALFRDYAARLLDSGYEIWSSVPYGYARLPNGDPLKSPARRSYLKALCASESSHEAEPPNPLLDSSVLTDRTSGQLGPTSDTSGEVPTSSYDHVPRELVALHGRRAPLSMTAAEERAYCHWFARDVYTGEGEIVELGCWLGGLTTSLAIGLLENQRTAAAERRIHAYDHFVWDSSMERVATGSRLQGRFREGSSFRAEYRERIQPWEHRIETRTADLATTGWEGGPIEFLVVDAMKSWALANAVLSGFFGSLIQGHSFVLYQDFAHYQTYWIHLIMFRLRHYFEKVAETSRGSSVVFRLRERIPTEQLESEYSLECFDVSEIEDAFDYSLGLVSPSKRPNVAAAKTVALASLGYHDLARSELESWSGWPLEESDRHAAAEWLASVAPSQATRARDG